VPLEQAQSPRVLYFVNNMAAHVCQQRSEFDRASEHLIRAADAVAKSNNSRTLPRLISTKIGIASLYSRQKNYQLALEQLDQAIQLADNNNMLDEYEVSIMFEQAGAETELENYDTA